MKGKKKEKSWGGQMTNEEIAIGNKKKYILYYSGVVSWS